MEEFIVSYEGRQNSITDYWQSSQFSLYLLLPLLCFLSPRVCFLFTNFFLSSRSLFLDFIEDPEIFFEKLRQFPTEIPMEFRRNFQWKKTSMKIPLEIWKSNGFRRKLVASSTIHFPNAFFIRDEHYFCSVIGSYTYYFYLKERS